jgi:pimeloyl-ACP methyl ester carboxylesterase
MPENMLRCKKFYGPLFKQIGISEPDLGEMEEFGISFVQLLGKQDVTYDEVAAHLKDCHGKRWYQKLCQTGLYSDTALNWTPEYYHQFYDHDYHGDARPFLGQTRCPILVIFGADDFKVDPLTYTQYCEEAGKKVGLGVITVKTFAGASHELTTPSDTPSKTYVPGYLDLMCEWLKDRCKEVGSIPKTAPDSATAH